MNKKSLAVSLAAIIAVAATGGIVYAQAVPQGASRTEVAERAAAAFDRLDVNVDGQIDAADRSEAQGERQRTRFDAADSNGDGALAFEEYSAARTAMRDQFAEGQGRGERGEGRRGGRHGGRDGGREGGGMGMRAIAATADTNGDNAISQAEFNTAALSHFDRADANDDGVMTREEGRAMRQTMRSEAQAQRRAARPAATPAAPASGT